MPTAPSPGTAPTEPPPVGPTLGTDAPSPSHSRQDVGGDARRWLMLPAVLVAMFMAQFDLYVVNVALPLFQADLHAGAAALELIVGGYAFVYAAGLISGGRLGDLFGYRRLFLAGMVGFGAASLLCGLARTPGGLVVARLAQGLTAAAIPQVLALITITFPASERPRALSWFGVTMGAGAVAGQVLGGLLLNVDLFGLGWRAIFFVNVPIAAATVAFAYRVLPARSAGARPKLDPLGAMGVSVSLALVLVPLTLGRSQGWPPWTWIALAAAGPAMVAVLAWERALTRRGGQPLLDLALFAVRAFNRGLVVNVAVFASFFSFVFTLTLVLQDGLGLTPLQAGLTFAPLGVAFAVASISAKRFIARHGATRVITAGTTTAAVGLAVGLAVLHLGGAATGAPDLVGPLIVVGLGNGLAVPALIGAVLAGMPTKAAGAAAGVLTTSQQFAAALGIASLGAVFFRALGARTGSGSYTSAMQWSTAASLLLALAASAISTRLPRTRSSPRSRRTAASSLPRGHLGRGLDLEHDPLRAPAPPGPR